MKARKYLIAGALVLGLSAPVMAQDYVSAIETVSNALKADPTGLGSAKNAVKDYMKMFKKNPEAMVALGNAYLSNKQFAKAVECADLALKKNKNYGDAYILKGDVESLKDDGGQAAGWYQQAMSLDPTNPHGYMRYANVYRKRSPQESERALAELRKNCPDFDVDAEAAHTFYTSGQYEKAMEYFERTNLQKLSEGRIGEYALTALSVGNSLKGLDVSKVAIQRFPSNHGFLRLALINGVGAQKYDDAIRYAEQLMGANDVEKNSGDYTYYGQALLGAQKYSEAIAQFTKSLSLDSESFKNLQLISEAYAGLGDEDQALEYSKQYLSKSPNVKVSEYNKLAGIYLAKVKKGIDKELNFANAMSVYDDIIEKFPTVKDWAMYQKGNQAFLAEMPDAAIANYMPLISALENASNLSDEQKTYLKAAYRAVGYAYWGDKNDLDTAKPFFEKLYQLDPNDKLAKQALGIDDAPAATE